MRPVIASLLCPIASKAISPPLRFYRPPFELLQAPSRASVRFHSTSPTTTISKTLTRPRTPKNPIQKRTMSSENIPDRYKLVFFVPHENADQCKDAVFATGAGTFPGGKYTKCCFQSTGTGQFVPNDGAAPAIGDVGALEKVEETRVEVMCFGRSVMLQAVEELIKAHPYEEVAYEVYKLENV